MPVYEPSYYAKKVERDIRDLAEAFQNKEIDYETFRATQKSFEEARESNKIAWNKLDEKEKVLALVDAMKIESSNQEKKIKALKEEIINLKAQLVKASSFKYYSDGTNDGLFRWFYQERPGDTLDELKPTC